MFKFPEILQFRQVIRNVKSKAQFAGLDEEGNPIMDRMAPMPTLTFIGSVKLHGTNASIVLNEDKTITTQSRNNVITPEKDNAGFAQFVSTFDPMVLFNEVIIKSVDSGERIVIYGEWCGGNIQKGVAITQLEKMFVVFAVKVGDTWLEPEKFKNVKSHEDYVFNIWDFPAFQIDIDFSNPEFAQNKMVELVNEVEAICPVGKAFGVEGVGEGIVWKPVDPEWNSSKFWFKTKGEKHSVSKVKKIASVDVEKVKTINEFVDKVVTENRLQQAISVLKEGKGDMPIERKHIGDIIRWVYNDVIKEETDTIQESGLKEKELGGPIAKRAKEWFFKNELEL